MNLNVLRYVKLEALCEGLGDHFRDEVADSTDVTYGDPVAKHVLVAKETLLRDILTGLDYDDEQQEYAAQLATLRDRLNKLPPDVLVDLQS